jgi:hypothetical protein
MMLGCAIIAESFQYRIVALTPLLEIIDPGKEPGEPAPPKQKAEMLTSEGRRPERADKRRRQPERAEMRALR